MILKNANFKTRMIVLVAIFLLGLIATHAMYVMMILQVRVNGPLYEEIARDKDIIADVLPPPEYIIEPYLVLLQAVQEKDPARQRELIERFKELETEYQTRHRHWVDTLSEGPLEQALVVDSYTPAEQFFRIASEQIIPKLESGADRGEVEAVIQGPIEQAYEAHRRAVDQVVQLAGDRIKDDELKAKGTSRWWMVTQLIFGVAVLAVLIAVSWAISRAILVPTAGLVERMQDMAEGAADLTKRVEVCSRDEIGQLGNLINAVIGRIHDLVARIQMATIHLNSTATEIAAAASEQNSTMQGFNASTAEIAASVKQISATTSELVATMGDVDQRADQAADLAETGRSSLAGMEATMQQLSDGTGSISGKLGMIREKAGAINTVVETINKVADQTNLLSINAAIEAEKAGEAGRGFLVVAREIRRLADQTAVATLDIEQMVRQMQDAVSAGVMEMDKFHDQVRTCIRQVAELSSQTEAIIEQVQVLHNRFHTVNEGMTQQSQGARQIDEAMVQLASGGKQVGETVKDFSAAAENLRTSARDLQQEVGQFKVSD